MLHFLAMKTMKVEVCKFDLEASMSYESFESEQVINF